MEQKLQGYSLAILVAHGFEQSELMEPKRALEEAGAHVVIISPEAKHVTAWHNDDWGTTINVDVPLSEAAPDDYHALVLPGGVMNPDTLRIDEMAVTFIKSFVDNNKPIAAICHGAWPLINAGGVAGKTMTSWASLAVDLTNAQANWVDRAVVRDGNLVTSRRPSDLTEFNVELVNLIQGKD
jgi:protease I